MLSMAIAALRSRRAQSVALTLLACLVVAGVVGTPYYLFAAADRLVVRDQANVPVGQRQADVSQDISSTNAEPIGDHVDTAVNGMKDLLHVQGSSSVVSLVSQSTLSSSKSLVALNGSIAYLDDVCAHVTLHGRCPATGTDAMISKAVADKLNLGIGDGFTWPNSIVHPAPQVHIVGIYQPKDATDPYWGVTMLASTQPNGSESTGDAAFVPLEAIKQYASEAMLDFRVRLPVGHLTQFQINDIDAQLADAQYQAPRISSGVTTSFGTLVDRVNRDVNNLLITVPVLACEMLALGWFALFLVVRATVSNRRADTGLVRLRGVPRGSTWFLMTAQSALPVLIAAPIGAVLGYLGARALAGPVTTDERLLALAIAAGAGVVVVAGALLAALGASRRGRSGPILEMLRDTPPRRRGWRSDAADVVVLLIAIFAIVQSHSASAPSGLVIVAPSLTALAIALVIARAIAPVSAQLVPRTIRSGRVSGLLTATYLARRPGLDRVFTLLMIVTALSGSSVISWRVATDAQQVRAAQEVGASTVVQLRQTTPGELLALTHSIDPSGQYLMAAAEFASSGGDRVLAVDSPRFGAIAPGPLPGDDLTSAEVGRMLRPKATASQSVSGDAMTLAIDGLTNSSGKDTYALAMIQTPSGVLTRLAFGPVTIGSHEYTQALTGCDPSCDVISYTVASASHHATQVAETAGPAAPGTSFVLRKCNGQPFPAAANWRTTMAIDGIGPVLSNSPGGGLGASLPKEIYGGPAVDPHIYPLNTPIPVPVVVAGKLQPPSFGGSVTFSAFGASAAPISIQGAVDAIPRLGHDGLIVDLGYAELLGAGSPGASKLEVWMAPDTPASMVKAVETAGPSVAAVESKSSSMAFYRDDSLESARQYALLGGVLGLALGVIALLLIGAAERASRARELASLRVQGVTERAMRRAIVAGYGLLCIGAVVLGILAAMIGRLISGGQTAVFADGWNVLHPPGTWTATGWLIATAITAAPIIITAALVARSLRRDVTRRLKAAKQ